MTLLKLRIRAWSTLLLAPLLAACTNDVPTVSVSLAPVISDTIVVSNVAVFDSRSLQVTPNRDVVVKGSQIVDVAKHNPANTWADAQVISGEGATLVPGLIDMHGHVTTTTGPTWEFALPRPEANLLAYVYSGVTTVFDPGDSSDDAYERRAKVANGELIGPQIFTAGRIITSPHGHPRALVENLAPWWARWYLVDKIATGIADQDDVVAEVNELSDAGADAIKIVVDSIPLDSEQMSDELIGALVDQAKQRGLRTVAHTGTTQDAIRAADAGVALWVHGVYKERIPDSLVGQLVGYGIPMVSTNEVFDRYGRALSGPITPSKLERETVPQEVLESFHPVPEDFDIGVLESWATLMANTIDVRLDNVRRLHQAGMTILAGSDTQSGVFPGAGMHRELATLVRAGLTPAQALRAATLDPAIYLSNGKVPDRGVIEKGKRADILLVNGDPLQDISALADIREVILNGQVLQRKAIAN